MLLALLVLLQTATGAERVAPGVLDTEADEYGPTLTADGRTIYFTKRVDRSGRENIMVAHLVGTKWSAPAVASFSGQGLDKEPYLAPDGKSLVFASRRAYPGKAPGGAGGAQGEEAYDLFVVEWKGGSGGGWGDPRPLSGANSAAYDNYPALAANGTLYFGSHRTGGAGRNDLWRSRLVNGAYQPAEPLAELNTPHTDADPYVAPDERYMIFTSDRPGGQGSGDLYVSFFRNGRWAAPVSLGPLVNTDDYEYTPWVTADGRWLYFSRGYGDLWRIETRLLLRGLLLGVLPNQRVAPVVEVVDG